MIGMPTLRGNQSFQLVSSMQPQGDQPRAIEELVSGLERDDKFQTLLGVTGSGKTFTMANVAARMNKPTLVLAHNKTLAAQLYQEFKELFPNNEVHYFVSYYDYYQPEAYIPSSDTFIEKDSSINEEIDKMRHAATTSLLQRNDVLIVASVSCIYGLGSPEAYNDLLVYLEPGREYNRDAMLHKLVEIQYERNDTDFHRGTFRVRGDVVEIFPVNTDEYAVRVEFWGDEIEGLTSIDPLTGKAIEKLPKFTIYPASHWVTTRDTMREAILDIQEELRDRLQELKSQNKLVEAQRLEQRTLYDIEMMEEMGFCSGIENYSRHLTRRKAGDPPPTLLDYFPRDFLMFIDESHVTVPQVRGMYRGDRSRKTNLVEYGFRLPSALDNRPLNFEEFEKLTNQVVFVSATPGPYELTQSEGVVVEQIIRPTGLIDPPIEVRTARNQVDDLLAEVREINKRGERVLITTLTKRLAEDLTSFYREAGIKIKYLHSDIDTLERVEIIRDLRIGTFDVLVGINLLREGLDIPEVSLVAILDADKEGFLRGETALIQTIGRAARNVNGRVIMYGDVMTDAMKKAMSETDRRRAIQVAYNEQHGITPTTVKKNITQNLLTLYNADYVEVPLAAEDAPIYNYKSAEEVEKEIQSLRKQMHKAAAEMEFEKAAELRDKIKTLRELQLQFT
jgi:excinuclease ABC subunit B